MQESKHKEALEARGFRQLPPTRINGEEVERAKDNPVFMMFAAFNVTEAYDELGNRWSKAGLENLSDLGFTDLTTLAQRVMNLFSTVTIDGEEVGIPKTH